MSTATRTQDVPRGEHWAIIRNRSVHIPGDERSRTNPGHGYPESTEEFIAYETFASEKAMLEALEREVNRVYSNSNARGIHVAATYRGRTIVEAVKE